MVFFNYSTMQMAAKVVYYGPGLCGKTTNLQWIFEHTSTDSRGEMVSLATETDRTLFFDLLPIDVGSIAGFSTRIQLYTVPGQVFYNTTRKLVLKGVDGVVFVADSQRNLVQANIDSFKNLEENLAEMGLTLETIPVVLQYNKRDLPNICTVEEMDEALNPNGWPALEASALNGDGVFETLKTISKATLLALKKRLTKGKDSGPSVSSAPRRPIAPKQAPPRKPSSTGPMAKTGSGTGPVSRPDTGPVAQQEAPATPSPEPVAAPSPPVVAPPALSPKPVAAPSPPPEAAELPSPLPEPVVAPSPSPEAAAPPSPRPAPAAPPSLRPAPAAPPSPPPAPAAPPSPPPEPISPPPALVASPSPPPETAAPPEPVAPPLSPPPEPVAAPSPPPKPVAPPSPPPAAPVAAAPSPAPAKKKRKSRSVGFDALEELEKLRREAIRPKAASTNGRREIRRDFAVKLDRDHLSQGRRFALMLRLEDAENQPLNAAKTLYIDVDDMESLEQLQLRLEIAVESKG